MGKLDLDWGLVKEARESAKKIAADSLVFLDAHSTVTVERTICRLLGIDGIDEFGVSLPNVLSPFEISCISSDTKNIKSKRGILAYFAKTKKPI